MALIGLAFFGALLILIGAALVSIPAAISVAGFGCVLVAYLIAEERGQ